MLGSDAKITDEVFSVLSAARECPYKGVEANFNNTKKGKDSSSFFGGMRQKVILSAKKYCDSDQWYREEYPGLVRARSPPHLTKADLLSVVEWKFQVRHEP